MNPELGTGINNFIRIKSEQYGGVALNEAERQRLLDTSARFWKFSLGRANHHGDRKLVLPCLNKIRLFEELQILEADQKVLEESGITLECSHHAGEPDLRTLLLVATYPAQQPQKFNLAVPVFQFWATRGNEYGDLSVVHLDHGGIRHIHPDSPEHKDIETIADFFIPE